MLGIKPYDLCYNPFTLTFLLILISQSDTLLKTCSSIRLQKVQQLGMRRKPRFLDLERRLVFILSN